MSSLTSLDTFLFPTPTSSLAPSGTQMIISGTPLATPLTCHPSVSREMFFSDVSGKYCTYNIDAGSSNKTIPYLASCCKPGAEVKMWQDCMLYCETSSKQADEWRGCVEEIYPQAKTDPHFEVVQVCYGLEGRGLEYIEGPNGTRAAEVAQSRTAVGSAVQTGDGEGKASGDRASLRLVGWMVAFLAVGAGLLA